MSQYVTFTTVLLVALALSIGFIFFVTVPKEPRTFVLIEGNYEATCTGTSLSVVVHSLERHKVHLETMTVLENNATCTAPVDYLILNTRTTIKCPGYYAKGNIYTIVFGGKGIRIRC